VAALLAGVTTLAVLLDVDGWALKPLICETWWSEYGCTDIYTRNVYYKQDETVLIIPALSRPPTRLTSESELSWCSGSWICGPNLTLGLCKDIIDSWGGQFQCGQSPITRQSVSKYTHNL